MTTNLFEVAVQFFQGYPETLTFVVDLLCRDNFLDDVVEEISLPTSEEQEHRHEYRDEIGQKDDESLLDGSAAFFSTLPFLEQ